MISRINSYMNSMLFKNPISPSERNPYSDSIYGASITAMYSAKLNKLASSELSSYVRSFSTGIGALKEASAKLSENTSDAVFKSKVAKSSSDAVEALSAASGVENRQYTVKVDKLATAQINNSAKLDSKAFNGFSTGTNTFSIKAGSKTASISIDIKSYHTNKDVLNEASSKINNSGLDLNSRVVSDDTGKSYLELSSKSTGTSNKFEIEDISGDFAGKSGITAIAQNAENARYSVDGKEYQSESNVVKLDSGKAEIRLRNTGEANISISDDRKKLNEAVKAFANSYNNTMNVLDGIEGNRNAARLKTDLSNTMRSRKASLESIGINVSDKGSISIDDKKLDEAVKGNAARVKSILGSSSGAASRINKLAAEAQSKPVLSFADKYQINSVNSSDMYNYMYTAQKQYLSKAMQQGILFDTTL